jgi:isomerase DpgB
VTLREPVPFTVPNREAENDVTTTTATLPVARIDGSAPLSAETVAAVTALCEQVEDSGAAVAVLHLTGAPAAGWAESLQVPLVNKWERALRRLERLDAATVAVVSGVVGGTAVEALLATDHRIAVAGTSLSLAAEDNGTWPGMALYRLVSQAGVAGARRTVLFGAAIDAERALALQLVDQVVGTEEEAQAALATVTAAAGRWPAMRRQLMLDAATTSFETALGSHLAACDRVLRAGTQS